MKLKTASRLETAIRIVLGIIILPIAVIDTIIKYIRYPFKWIIEEVLGLLHFIGNKLMLISDEANDGTIQNKDVLKRYTARMAWETLKEEINLK